MIIKLFPLAQFGLLRTFLTEIQPFYINCGVKAGKKPKIQTCKNYNIIMISFSIPDIFLKNVKQNYIFMHEQKIFITYSYVLNCVFPSLSNIHV